MSADPLTRTLDRLHTIASAIDGLDADFPSLPMAAKSIINGDEYFRHLSGHGVRAMAAAIDRALDDVDALWPLDRACLKAVEEAVR